MLSRSELEELGKDELVSRAEGAGVARARFLTKPELVDELLLTTARERGASRAALRKARGFFGVARDLIFGALEKGLHLPDAAERFRSAPPPPPFRNTPPAVATVTLAQIYLAQGHPEKAMETLRRLLESEPDDEEAARLLAELRDASFVPPKPPVFDRDEDAANVFEDDDDWGDDDDDAFEANDEDANESVVAPVAALAPVAVLAPVADADDAVSSVAARGTLEPSPTFRSPGTGPLPPIGPRTTCHALVVEDGLRVAWSIDAATCAHYQGRYPGGRFVVRSVAITPRVEGPVRGVQDRDVDREGEVTVSRAPRAVMRVSVGWKYGDSYRAIAQG